TKDDKLTSDSLQSWLTSGACALIHYVSYVDQETGHLTFSEVDQKSGESRTKEVDRMTAEGFRHLVAQCNPRLVVFGTCHALLLAAVLSRTTNVITANGFIEGKQVAQWARLFYRLLAKGERLTVAYETATATTSVQMILLLRQDFRFQPDS
ncbi:MAG TPA: hypothetical protein VFE78_18940, partial [Gemmataceae bacterium]|nr:hypothetical protein [Gemmataceae bacterium]